MRFLAIFAFLSTAWAGEFAVFPSGSRLRIDRHEMVGGTKLRLYAGEGFTELSPSAVVRFEPDDAVPAAGQPGPSAAPAVEAPSLQLTPARPLSPRELADRAADKYGLPRQLVRSVMSAESGFSPRAVSPKGAVGLMQLMPSTALDLGADANDPAQNVDAGARYLRDLLVKYNGALWHALAAYNAGPGAVDKYGTVPPYPETVQYIKRIEREMKKAAGTNP
ncbi:MAG TPA: lytic transglycosylase domain-containing protein [Bryobacteraceae bacterium]|nr:lytic transglycosylase domain-containing protein [Bryobacteraceae bacterium]